LLAVVLVVAAALFAVGTRVEHSRHHHDEHATLETGDEAAERAATEHEVSEPKERVLGIDVESGGVVASVVVLALVLAGAVARTRARMVLFVVAAFAAISTILDIGEFLHQVDESRNGLAALVAVVVALHAFVAVGALAFSTE
jgi:hypothetical protein